MIPRSAELRHTPAWQQALAQAIHDPRELLAALELEGLVPAPTAAEAARFPLRVPRGFVARMHKGDPNDPLLRQVLPVDEEGHILPGYSTDPLEELDAMPVPGVLHKYAGRVLVTLTGACGVHCRYCFRRHFPYSDANPGNDDWSATLEYLHKHDDIHEVLLSGGDPLAVSDRRLGVLVEALNTLPHLKRLRIHTRMPVVLPERVDSHLLDWMDDSRLRLIMVLHVNHAREISPEVSVALSRLRDRDVQLLNQAVLLRGINDSVESQLALAETLFDSGVLPYYLHLLDPVQGAAHFDVPETEARGLLADMQARLPGYLVPRLVREEPAASSKTWIPSHNES